VLDEDDADDALAAGEAVGGGVEELALAVRGGDIGLGVLVHPAGGERAVRAERGAGPT